MKLIYFKKEDIQEKVKELQWVLDNQEKFNSSDLTIVMAELNIYRQLLSEGKDVEEVFNAGRNGDNKSLNFTFLHQTYTDFLNSIEQ